MPLFNQQFRLLYLLFEVNFHNRVVRQTDGKSTFSSNMRKQLSVIDIPRIQYILTRLAIYYVLCIGGAVVVTTLTLTLACS